MSTTYNFGITPTYSFNDVSGIVAGETITLCDVAYSFTGEDQVITLGASFLNDMIDDSAVGPNPKDTEFQIEGTDVSVGSANIIVPEGLKISLNGMAEGSAKATIARAITGNSLGNIGELENDTTFESLFSEDLFKEAIAESIVSDPVVSVAEDILRNLGLSDASDGGRSTSSPFEKDDTLDFNMFVRNGVIRLVVDTATDLTNDPNGVTFFADPVQKLGIGVGSERYSANDYNNGIIVNSDGNADVYAGEANRYAKDTLRVVGGTGTEVQGVVSNDDTDAGVLIRLRMKLTE